MRATRLLGVLVLVGLLVFVLTWQAGGPGLTGATSGSTASRIVFESDRDANTEVYVMNADGSAQTRLTNNPASDGEADCAPDGDEIAFTSNRDGNNEVYVMEDDGTGQVNLTKFPADDTAPDWSPDGDRIAFHSTRDDPLSIFSDVYTMDDDGADITRLTFLQPSFPPGRSASRPVWSPDGTRIAFERTADGHSDIFLMNTDGSGQVNVTNRSGGDGQPTWSPDGSKIAFSSDHSGNSDIWVINADGSNPVNVTSDAAQDFIPDWSPDGTRIAFASNRSGDFEVWVMNPDGSNAVNLTNSPGRDSPGAWCAVDDDEIDDDN